MLLLKPFLFVLMVSGYKFGDKFGGNSGEKSIAFQVSNPPPSVSPSLRLSVSPSLRLSVSLSLHFPVSLSLCLSYSLSLCLSVSLSSVSLSLCLFTKNHFRKKNNIPEHSLVLHSKVSEERPSHSSPPFDGVGLSQTLDLVCIPPPQDRVQVVGSDHSPQFPFSVWTKICENDTGKLQ